MGKLANIKENNDVCMLLDVAVCQVRLPIALDNGGGHLEFCASCEPVQWL